VAEREAPARSLSAAEEGRGPHRRFRRILSPDCRRFSAFRNSPNADSATRRGTKRTRRHAVGPVRFNHVSRGRLNAARLYEVNWERSGDQKLIASISLNGQLTYYNVYTIELA
jgi:hypothetical protein